MDNHKWLKFLISEQQHPSDNTDYGQEESPYNHNAELLEKEYGVYMTNRRQKYKPDPVVRKVMAKDLGITPEEYDEKEMKLHDGLYSADILDNIKIGNKIGQGHYGTVFDIENSNRAIKFFESSFDMKRDTERFETISNDMFRGKASLKDFHIFEMGKLGNTRLYYAVMPKIIPLPKAPFYRLSEIFKDAANLNVRAARSWANDYDELTIENWNKFILDTLRVEYQEEIIEQYSETLYKIVEAGYRAYSEFGAKDIHKDNIGYYPQKPDIFFYFDM